LTEHKIIVATIRVNTKNLIIIYTLQKQNQKYRAHTFNELSFSIAIFISFSMFLLW